MSVSVQPGSVVSHYRLLERIGAGGMGEVFVAFDTRVNRRVAVKFLQAPTARRDLFERFQNEARLHARLFHPNIARLFGFFSDAKPPYLVMEIVEGPTLKDWMQQARSIDWHERLRVFTGIADGVGYLHANGIIHRDIKPGNVRLSRDGRPKLLDFGIAKDSLTPNLTMAGNVVGTLQFLAPEQLEGKAADKRSDVWALGILLYELLTGRLPFASDSLSELMSKVRKSRFPLPTVIDASLSPAVDRLVKSCLNPNPDDRPQDGADLARSVRDLMREDSSAVDGSSHGNAAGLKRGQKRSGSGRGITIPPLAWKLAAGSAGLVALGAGSYALLSSEDMLVPQATNCDQVASNGRTFPVNIQGNSGTFEVWVNDVSCGTTDADGVWFRAVAGSKLTIECRPVPHGQRTTHEITVGATNVYSCP